jgi:hypothetical protein
VPHISAPVGDAGIHRERPILGAVGTELISLRLVINKPVPTPEPPPVVGGGGNSREGNRAQIREGQYSLEAIRCRQRSTLGKGNAHEERQNLGCSGSTELAIVVSRRSRWEISLWKGDDRQKERKAGGHCRWQ